MLTTREIGALSQQSGTDELQISLEIKEATMRKPEIIKIARYDQSI
jgi:hypothetical protein